MVDRDIVKCFFAYPSKPKSLAEIIEAAIASLNTTGLVQVKGWKELQVSGKVVINEICKAIVDADLFLCEVTNLNPNVLFELGYAIAKDKAIWLLLDKSIPDAEANYKSLNVFSSIGYATYTNSSDIVNAFLADQPYTTLENTIYNAYL
jgi:nucleoside 2-deoxyribosyltransferase